MAEAQVGEGSSAPLLEKAAAGGVVYLDGCPGCAVDRRKAASPGIPYGNFLYVWIVTLCTAYHIDLVLSISFGAVRATSLSRFSPGHLGFLCPLPTSHAVLGVSQVEP